jgi:hypothetical protein
MNLRGQVSQLGALVSYKHRGKGFNNISDIFLYPLTRDLSVLKRLIHIFESLDDLTARASRAFFEGLTLGLGRMFEVKLSLCLLSFSH